MRSEDWADGWNTGRNQGIRYSIATVEAIRFISTAGNSAATVDQVLAALRALLEEKP